MYPLLEVIALLCPQHSHCFYRESCQPIPEKRPDNFISTLAFLLWFDVVEGFHSGNYFSCCTVQMHMVHPLADLFAYWLCDVSSEITPVCLCAAV